MHAWLWVCACARVRACPPTAAACPPPTPPPMTRRRSLADTPRADSWVLRPIKWAYMMVDEAHRLKNDEAALYKARQCVVWEWGCAGESGASSTSSRCPLAATRKPLDGAPAHHHPMTPPPLLIPLLQELMQWTFYSKLLITGTPLQVRARSFALAPQLHVLGVRRAPRGRAPPRFTHAPPPPRSTPPHPAHPTP